MSSRKALAYSFVDRYAGLLLSIVASMVVARLLDPAEIGVFSVAMVMLSFISVLRDFGAGQYLVQEKELTTERIRATWTVQLGLGLTFALVVLAAAVPASHFYAEPRLRDIMVVLSLNFAVSPFGSLTYAWLMREMDFRSLALMRFTGSLTGACVCIGMAWQGWGPISLAAGSLAATVANAVVAVHFRPASFPWIPGLTDVRRVLSFGGKLSATTVINTFGNSIPELVLGKVQGMVMVGLYSRGNGLAGMFNRLILDATQSVAMPLFSKASREGHDLTPIFIKATSYVTVIGWSFFGVMIVLAQPIMRLLYGDQWDGAVPVTRLVAAAMAIGLPVAFCSTMLMASGQMGALLRITLCTVLQYAACVGVGAALGLEPLGWSIVLATLINVALWLLMSPQMRHVPKWAYAKMLLRSGGVAATVVAASTLAFPWVPQSTYGYVVELAIGAAASSVVFVAAIFLLHHPLRDEFQLLRVWYEKNPQSS